MKRAIAWIISAAVLVFVALFVTHLYLTIPSGEADPVLIGAIGAAVLVFVASVVGVWIHDVIIDRRYREDPEEYTEPLRTGSGGAERRMRRYFVTHGQILLNRASGATRKRNAALDATGPLPRFPRRRARRAILAVRQAGRDVLTAVTPSRKVKVETPPRIRGGRHAMGQLVLPRPAGLDEQLMGHRFDEWPPEGEPEAESLEPLPPDTGPAVTVALIPTQVTTSPLAPFFPVSPAPPQPEVTVERLGAPSVPEGDDVTDLLPIGQFDEPEPPEEPPAPVSEAPRPRPQDRPFTDWLRDSVVMEAIKDGAPS